MNYVLTYVIGIFLINVRGGVSNKLIGRERSSVPQRGCFLLSTSLSVLCGVLVFLPVRQLGAD
jgi:hypothetical protein